MAQLRLALLNASITAAAIESTARNFRRELDATLTEFVVSDGQLPETFDFDGVVISGSAASAYWDEPWIEQTREWIKTAHDRGLPILGVCFGHQLLASALGGTVESMDEFEIGYHEVKHTDSELFEGIDERFTVFVTHGDRVSELPPGATLIAENEYGVHGFRLGDAFGVQFHPEYDTESATAVTKRKEFLGEETIQAVLDDITPENYDRACETKQLFETFTTLVADRQQAQAQ
ncbi:type 1 glutamine amidotransferase [Halocatena halophila]|uniref:type 1 glutamine amidotransferase n=1 Tax=Halocatena halophila TaxID=2814576 RepID=UPI002ED2B7CF